MRALRACAAQPRSFPPPRAALPIRFRGLSGRGLAPTARRRANCGTLLHRSVTGAATFLGRRPFCRDRGAGAKPRPPFFRRLFARSRSRPPRRAVDKPSDHWAGHLKPPPGRDPASFTAGAVCAVQRNRLAAAFRLPRARYGEIRGRGLRGAKKPPCGGFFAGKRVFIYQAPGQRRVLLSRPVQAVVGVGKN